MALHDQLKDEPLIRTIFAPHAPYTVSDAPLLKLRQYANELGIGIHMHVHETAHEVESAVVASGKRPWARLKELELLGPDRSEEHTSELQSLMRISYAVFCLKKKKKNTELSN